MTRSSSSTLCMAIGFLIAAAALVSLVWIQVDGLSVPSHEAAYRLQIAMLPLMVVGIGILIAIAGLIVGELQTRRLVESSDQLTPRTP